MKYVSIVLATSALLLGAGLSGQALAVNDEPLRDAWANGWSEPDRRNHGAAGACGKPVNSQTRGFPGTWSEFGGGGAGDAGVFSGLPGTVHSTKETAVP